MSGGLLTIITSEWVAILSKWLVFGYVWVQENKVAEVRNAVGQASNGKVLAREWLKHENFSISSVCFLRTKPRMALE